MEADKALCWMATRADGSMDGGYVDTEEEADQFKKDDDITFGVVPNDTKIPESVESKAIDFFEELGEQRDDSSWYWQTTFIYGVIKRKDFLIDGVKHVPNKFLINKPFRYIYAIYAIAYTEDGVHLSSEEFKQRLIESQKIREEWKEGIFTCFKVSVGSRVNITEDEFSSAIKHLTRRQKGKIFAKEIKQAQKLAGQGKFEEADERLTNYLYSFKDLDEKHRPSSLARMSSFALDEYRNRKDYSFPTGFGRLDALTGGGWKGETWIVGGYTSDGKTQLAKEIIFPSMKRGDNILFVSLEMLKEEMEQIFHVRLAYELGFKELTLNKIRRKQLNDHEFELYKIVIEKARQHTNLFIHQPVGKFTMMDLEMEIDRIRAYTHLDAVVIDYLELVDPHRAYESERVRVKEIMRRAKRLATRKNIWTIVPHQISREGRKRAERRNPPYYTMADFQESSGVEQNCTVMTWIYQDDKYRDKQRARMGCAKNRMGAIDTVGWEIGTDWKHCRCFWDHGLEIADQIEIEGEDD